MTDEEKIKEHYLLILAGLSMHARLLSGEPKNMDASLAWSDAEEMMEALDSRSKDGNPNG